MSKNIIVFGSNAAGFHGAGGAGFAFNGSTQNDWRTCPKKQAAMEATRQHGNSPWPSYKGPDPRIGKHNVWGKSHGYQVGTEGASYAICTVTKPGGPKTPVEEGKTQFDSLFAFAKSHPECSIIMTEVGCGLAGHNKPDLRAALDRTITGSGKPKNIVNLDQVYLSTSAM